MVPDNPKLETNSSTPKECRLTNDGREDGHFEHPALVFLVVLDVQAKNSTLPTELPCSLVNHPN
jgi:hypothetical protein